MKGCRGVQRELAATEGEGSVQEVTAARNGAKRRTSVGLNGDERERQRGGREGELRRGCLQFPSNFVGNIVTPR